MQYLNPKGHPPLKFYQLIIWRWCATISAYLFLSLAYSFVSMAFQINFTHTNPITSETQATNIDYLNPVAYGHGSFVVYWMLNFWGMIALGLACENVAMVVGAPWMGMWLIFWVITNVCTAFYDIEIAPGFYRWGYAWPLHSGKSLSPLSTLACHPLKHLLTRLLHSRRRKQANPVRSTFAHWSRFWHFDRLGSSQYPFLPLMRLVPALENTEGNP